MPGAQLRLAHLKADNSQACATPVFWYRQAAAHGEAQAMYELGKLYMEKSCGANRTRAFLWLYLAGRYGLRKGETEATELAASLTGDQRRNCERIADNWIRRHSGAKREEDEESEKEKR